MKFTFLVEDRFGPHFFEIFFRKKVSEGIFSGRLKRVRRCSIGNKMTRIISANAGKVDRIIIIADADGGSLEDKRSDILRYVSKTDAEHVMVVLMNYEIEEWICYSEGIEFGSQKPSDVLKHRKNYRKQRLPCYADKMDCQRLQGCKSFAALARSLES